MSTKHIYKCKCGFEYPVDKSPNEYCVCGEKMIKKEIKIPKIKGKHFSFYCSDINIDFLN